MKIGFLETQLFVDAPSALASGRHLLRFPLRRSVSGASRLQEIREILGEDPAPLLARFGSYELADELVRDISLKGIRLGENGECEFLSPSRWTPATEPLFDMLSIEAYFRDQAVRNTELLVPLWAIPFQKKVEEAKLLLLYEQLLSPVSPYLFFRVEK